MTAIWKHYLLSFLQSLIYLILNDDTSLVSQAESSRVLFVLKQLNEMLVIEYVVEKTSNIAQKIEQRLPDTVKVS